MSKVWLVTGSGRGLGRDIVKAALGAGDRVVAAARDPRQLADLLEQHGEQIRTVALDVIDPVAAQAAVKVALDAFGRLDVLVNNAAPRCRGCASMSGTKPEIPRRSRLSW